MYSDGEALILTKLQSVTGFTNTTDKINTSRGKWGILNSGANDHYGIIKPGAFTRTQGAMSMNISYFDTVIQVWQRYVDDGTSLTNLEGHVKNIINYFDIWRKAGDTTGTIVDVFISGGGEVTEQWNKDGGLSWLKQDLTVTWQEHDNVSYGE
jgi:hypothetical protein